MVSFLVVKMAHQSLQSRAYVLVTMIPLSPQDRHCTNGNGFTRDQMSMRQLDLYACNLN